jgi:uncharacterized protein
LIASHGIFTAMIIDFSIKNYRSFRSEQRISFVASNSYRDLPENIIDPGLEGRGFSDLRLLKGLAIYGANAAGKSNVLTALHFLKHLVENSATELDEGDPTGIEPFALDPAMLEAPGEFVLRFALAGVRYHFVVVLDRRRILFESLSAFPKGREQVWYERSWDDETKAYTWSPARPTDYRRDASRVSVTRENALYLSTAVKFNDVQLRPIYLWFKEKMRFLPLDVHAPRLSPSFTVKRMMEDANERGRILRLLQHADIGVLSASARERDLTRGDLPSDLPETVAERILKNNKHLEIRLGHRGHEGQEFPLPWEEESAGTQRFFALAGPWLDILKNGYFVGLDEIESSMHPAMVSELLKLFFAAQTNARGAQLLFTTHNPLLLDTEAMRRDQVWFADKDDEGATHLYPLTDYKPRNKESLVRGYMAGRYGAIPFIPHGLLNEPMEAHANG